MNEELENQLKRTGILPQVRVTWEDAIKALEKNASPKAQLLAKKFRNKYNLSTSLSDKKETNNMEEVKKEESILEKVDESQETAPPVEDESQVKE